MCFARTQEQGSIDASVHKVDLHIAGEEDPNGSYLDVQAAGPVAEVKEKDLVDGKLQRPTGEVTEVPRCRYVITPGFRSEDPFKSWGKRVY